MPINKNAAYRYRLIDEALCRRHKRWRFDELVEHIAQRVEEAGMSSQGVCRRTVETDISILRSDPPVGYAAPIVRKRGEIYYEDPAFTIGQPLLSEADLKRIQEALHVLRQFPGLPHADQLAALASKLVGAEAMGQLQATLAGRALSFEHNPRLAGLSWLSPIYSAILGSRVLRVQYQAFGSPEPETFDLSPYFLKQYNQRWFLLCHQHAQGDFTILGIERIQHLSDSPAPFVPNARADLDPATYFQHVVGITRPSPAQPQHILLEFSAQRAPYILTKPLHPSQQLVALLPDGRAHLALCLIPNFELRAILLSHAGALRVLEPASLRQELAELHRQGLAAAEPLP